MKFLKTVGNIIGFLIGLALIAFFLWLGVQIIQAFGALK